MRNGRKSRARSKRANHLPAAVSRYDEFHSLEPPSLPQRRYRHKRCSELLYHNTRLQSGPDTMRRHRKIQVSDTFRCKCIQYRANT